MALEVQPEAASTLWRFHKESGEPDTVGLYNDALTASQSYSAWTNTNQDFNSNGFIPLVFVDEGGDRGVYVGWEWPEGRIQASTAGTGSPPSVTLRAGVPDDFKTDIPAGGVYEIPSAYLGVYEGDVDRGSNIFKRWFFENKAPAKTRTDTREPYTQMAEMLMGQHYDLASWGVDALQWDYGWWPGAASGGWRTGEGDWRLGNPGYYEGLDMRGISTWEEYGQALEDENLEYTNYFLLHDGLSADADALTSIGTNGHPAWFSNRQISAGASADLGDEDAVDFIKQRLLEVMTDNHIDTYRSDFEPIVRSSDKLNRHQYASDVQYWAAKGFYEVLDYMYDNLPGFRYENNSSGGSLKDYATLSRSSVVVYNDSANYEDIRQTFYTTSYAIHPAQMISYVNPDVFSSIAGEDDYGWRSVILSAMHIASPGALGGHLPYNEELYAEKYYGMFRDRLRPLVRNADLYHILPRPDGIHWDGVQYFDPDVDDSGGGGRRRLLVQADEYGRLDQDDRLQRSRSCGDLRCRIRRPRVAKYD
ncbi:alpha-galactosidase [Cohnella rhizosphaerae]|uniref:Alpha-galactosidase n=1 Tax=Cohnella rhizosphaerae TaxID=1457232 RepID=A0A9X4KT18_9BACL|nr:alpha-galactosidase [Cohnella rhizosphaerae]MDG0810038.1 alpha-galactosidase [Cohnella rhizosphaerae]